MPGMGGMPGGMGGMGGMGGGFPFDFGGTELSLRVLH